MGIRKVFKLSDKSIILGTELESSDINVTIGSPINLTQVVNPNTGEPEIAFLPMDIIFADVTESKDSITIKHSHIMWEKDIADFPAYEQNYVHQTTGIEAVSTGGIIKG